MTEKRFRANFDVSIYDSEKEEYISARERGLEEIAKIMNEQQSTINELQSIKKQCNHKKAILDFLKFMKMGNPLMEIMIDEFLEEVYDGENYE